MKNKLLILIGIIALALSMDSCARDEYCYSCRSLRQYPPVYRTYQDEDHGGMDYNHGGKYCNHGSPVYY